MSDIARLVRRICLLREQGDAEAANRIEQNDLGTAVRDLRLAEGPEALPAEELQELFAREEQRVADALILAELLIPRLADARLAAKVLRVPSNPPQRHEEPARATSRVESGSGSPGIPDLLDAMLAADGAARRRAD